jgi:hypothetical protein
LTTITLNVMRFENCPEAQCRMPAEVVDHFTLPSTHGPVDHLALRCLDGHQFVAPVEALRIAS